MLKFKRLKNLAGKKDPDRKLKERFKNLFSDEGADELYSDPPGSEKKRLSRKEKRIRKKAKWKARPLSLRIFVQSVKTVFIRLPLLLIVIIASALIFINLYLKPPVVEGLIRGGFSKISTGSIDLKVESFSPYTGFVIKDIIVRSGPDFDRAKFFEMERLVFRFGFFRSFIGSIRFPEIGIYKPRVYLFQKKGVWNTETLIKPSDEKKESEPEPEKKKEDVDGPASPEIRLPLAVDFLLNFILDDLCVYVHGEDFTTELTGLTFNANINVPPVRVIPKSVEAVRILKTMKFELNPRDSMNVKFYSKDAATAPELILNWKLVFSNGDKPEFNSSLNAGAKRMPLRLKNRFFSPFNFLITYDIFYNPINDILKINNFSFSFMNSDWIKLSGTVNSVTKTQLLNIKMDSSLIPLKDIYPYYVLMTDDRETRFGGEISLYPLEIRGSVKNPEIKGKISLKNLYFRVPGTEGAIPLLELDYSAALSGSTANLGAELSIPHLAYVIDGSKSGDTGLKLSVSATGYDDFRRVKINNFSYDFFSPSAGKVIALNLSADLSLGKAVHGSVSIPKLRINTVPLLGMVPGRFRKQLAGIPLKKPVDLNITANFYLGSVINAGVDLLAAVPDYGISDLRLKASVSQDDRAKRVVINNISLGSRNMNLSINAGGFVEMKKDPMSDSNLKFAVELNNPKMKSIWGPWNTSGQLKLSATLKGDLDTGKAAGSLEFKNFSLANSAEKLEVSGLNMNFPFEYELKERKAGVSLISVTQRQVIETEQFSEKPNFSIASIKAMHPARNQSFEYLKNFSAYMIFRENVFRISNLRAEALDGAVKSRTILVNLADFKLKNMEFNVNLDVTNVNAGRLDDQITKNISKEAEISLSANFSGKGLNIKKELNPSGSISIYKIGKKFANRLMKGLSHKKGKSKLGRPVQYVVDNSIPESFDFKLEKGLVYTTVKFKNRPLNYLFRVQKDEVVYDRIPIQEYFRKVSEAE